MRDWMKHCAASDLISEGIKVPINVKILLNMFGREMGSQWLISLDKPKKPYNPEWFKFKLLPILHAVEVRKRTKNGYQQNPANEFNAYGLSPPLQQPAAFFSVCNTPQLELSIGDIVRDNTNQLLRIELFAVFNSSPPHFVIITSLITKAANGFGFLQNQHCLTYVENIVSRIKFIPVQDGSFSLFE
jgi:hypothetical protein